MLSFCGISILSLKTGVMLKTGLFVLLCIFINAVYGQTSFTYTFDSTTLSVLFGQKEIMNAGRSAFLFDMTGKWRYAQTDSVGIDIRGFYINDQIDSARQQTLRVKCNLFGKRFTQQIQPGTYELSRIVSIKSIQKHPYIKFRAKTLKRRKKDSLAFDSFDFMAVQKHSP
jgi:hypothetical protein